MCAIKHRLMFENYKDCLFNDKIILKLQQVLRSDHHNVFTVEINKITLSSNDNKKLQTFDRVTKYPCRTNPIKGYETEMIIVRDFFIKKYADCLLYDGIVLQQR